MRLRVIVSLLSLPVLIAGLSVGMAEAAPSTVYVGKTNCSDTGPGTQNHPYCTVGVGVTNVANGGTVSINKGTYSEQVVVPTGKNNITLKGEGNSTTIQFPNTMTTGGSIVDVQATGTTLKDLSISGPFPVTGCGNPEYGVYFEMGSSGIITDSRIIDIESTSTSLRGCQQGIAVQIGSATDTTTGSATITDTNINNYQKNGISVANTGSSAKISDSNIVGYGPSNVIAQNGIEVIDGATATISDNTIKDNIYSPQSYAATGILLYSSGVVSLKDNVANHNDIDIAAIGVHNSTFKDNTTNTGTFNGIYLDSGSAGNTLTDNSAHGTTKGPDNYDMEDDSRDSGTLGTANTWHDNSCDTSSPAKLCKQ